MKLPGVAVATLCVVVASTISSLASTEYKGPPKVKKVDVKCGDGKDTQQEVTLPNSTVELACSNTSETFKPTIQQNQSATEVCGDAECEDGKKVLLSSLCPGATIKGGTEGGKATITIPQLPTTTKVFYIQCLKSSQKNCTATITVQAALPQGPQSCAEPSGSVTLQIQEGGGLAYFACGAGFTLNPTDVTKALSADCSKVEDVKELTRTINTEGNYVELKATKKKKKTVCYVCKNTSPGKVNNREATGDCKVFVHVSGSAPLLSRVVFALTLPVVLTLQHLT